MSVDTNKDMKKYSEYWQLTNVPFALTNDPIREKYLKEINNTNILYDGENDEKKFPYTYEMKIARASILSKMPFQFFPHFRHIG